MGPLMLIVVVLGIPLAFLGMAIWAIMDPPRPTRRLTLRGAVEAGVDKAIEEYRPTLAKMVAEQVMADPVIRFVKQIQWRINEAAPDMDGKESWERAAGALRQFLKDENAMFGDPRFSWDRAGARDLADAYEIDCW